MDLTVTGKGLGLAIMTPAETVLCGFVICCREEYRELECGLGATTRGLIPGATEIISRRRSCMIMVETWSMNLMVHVERVILISGLSYSSLIVSEELW